MKCKGHILIVDDNKSVLSAAELLLKASFEKVVALSSPDRVRQAVKDEKIDVVLLDMNFKSGVNNGNEGLYWLSEIKKVDESVQVVLFTAYADIELAVKGMKEGAVDFVVKPWDNDKLLNTIQMAYRSRSNSSKPEEKALKAVNKNTMFWGESKAMREVRSLVEKVANTDANILITGENGTGKEMIAKEIHRLSSRCRNPMVTVDMGAITETLFEGELFGHVKGAFTDAKTDRIGKFEAANHSTIFLDEIGNLSYHLQAKLLSVLQQRSIVRIGDNVPIPIDIRLICATNRDLDSMIRKDTFREDLLYRINSINIHLPPLRERKDDIIPLAKMLLDKQAKSYDKEGLTFSKSAEEALLAHQWSGNVRELEHAIEKAVIISDTKMLDVGSFDLKPVVGIGPKDVMEGTLEDMERQLIRCAMMKHSGNLSLVANELGISRQTLYNKLKRFNL